MRENSVSVVVPVFNGEKTLEQLFLRTKAHFDNLGLHFEMVLVEDCGTDHSWNLIRNLKKRFPDRVKGIRLARNSGQYAATMCGLAQASGSLAITMDDDLQTPPEEIKKLLQRYQETKADLVYGIPVKRQHSAWRNLGSKLLKKIAGIAFSGVAEASSFRLMKAGLVQQLLTQNQTGEFIDTQVRRHASSIAFQEVAHEKRQHGQSGYSFSRLIVLAVKLLANRFLFSKPARQGAKPVYSIGEIA